MEWASKYGAEKEKIMIEANSRDDINEDGEKRDHGHDANLAIDEDGTLSRTLG